MNVVSAGIPQNLAAGFTPTYGTVLSLTGQTASLGAQNLLSNAPAGLYRLSWYIVVTTVGTAGTITASINWSDEAQAQTKSVVSGVITSLLFSGDTIMFHSAAGNNISMSTVFTGVLGSPQYSLYAVLQRLA